MTNLSHIRRDDRGVLSIAGPDARTFLQGLVTNDVAALTTDRAQYGALLTPQGRIIADFFGYAIGDRVLLETSRRSLEALHKKLSMYRLRSKVELTDESAAFTVVLFPGAEAILALSLPDEPGAARPWHGGVLFTDPRLSELGARAVVPTATVEAALAETDASPADPGDYEHLRLALGVPEGHDDLPPEKALPMESGLDELNALSWSKGCYMGQELTARMRYRALVKKRLLPVAVDGAPPPPGTPVTQNGAEVGEMRSAGDGLGLAYLRLTALENDAPLLAGEARLTPRRPDWIRIARDEPAGG